MGLIMRLKSIVLVLIFLAGCQHLNNAQDVAAKNVKDVTGETKSIVPIAKQALIWQKATVSYIADFGGFYGLITEKGEKLLPVNLPDNFKVSGALVNVLGSKAPDITTAINWGTPFDVKQINLLGSEATN